MTTPTKKGGEKAATNKRRTRESHAKTKASTAIIYGLRTRSDTEYFYVGSTNNRKRRLADYLCGRPTHNAALTAKICSIGRDNLMMDTLAEVSVSDRFKAEARWIVALTEDGAPLLNHRGECAAVKEIRQFLAAMAYAPIYELTPEPLRPFAAGYLYIGEELRKTHGDALRETHPALIEELNRSLLRMSNTPITRPSVEELHAAVAFADKGGWNVYGWTPEVAR